MWSRDTCIDFNGLGLNEPGWSHRLEYYLAENGVVEFCILHGTIHGIVFVRKMIPQIGPGEPLFFCNRDF